MPAKLDPSQHREALATLASRGGELSSRWRFDWSVEHREAARRLSLAEDVLEGLTLCAVVGGASSGKSTVFNNLLDGRLASRVTARGHATLGPILAIHESKRRQIAPLLADDGVLAGAARRYVDLDDNTAGDVAALCVVFHDFDALAHVLVFDTPDFTSEAARLEGDVTLRLLPWFDRLIVVIDHERWFDRQTISQLKRYSTRFGQSRIALFNRTQEGDLADAERRLLEQQAERLGAEHATILEFRRGRGFCRFPPGTLDEALATLTRPAPSRARKLASFVAQGCTDVLNQNAERASRLDKLQATLSDVTRRQAPTAWDCATAMMNRREREHLDWVSRVLRIRQTRQWLADQRNRIEGVLHKVPLVGAAVGARRPAESDAAADPDDRVALARVYVEKHLMRVAHDLNRAAKSSRFWNEVKRWTKVDSRPVAFEWNDEVESRVREAAGAIDTALTRWHEKVERECAGLTSNVAGAAGAGAIGLAIVLIAVQGPVGALTGPAAIGAIWGSAGKLAAMAGTGALMGKQAGRLMSVVREKLIGTTEFTAVTRAAADFVATVTALGEELAAQHLDQARDLVIGPDEPLLAALEVVSGEA